MLRWRSIAPFAFLALSGFAHAQQTPNQSVPPRDIATMPDRSTGVIKGRVTAADTQEPLRRVQVTLTPLTAPVREPLDTVTGDDGRYEFNQLRPGRYELSARKGGYVAIEYGQRRPFEKGRPIDLDDRQVLERADIALPPGAVVTGRIFDEAGEPVAHASVQLGRFRYVDGRRRIIPIASDSTDDRGEFRIFGVAPGEYYLIAHFGDRTSGSTDRVRYVPTFYPGTSSVGEAQRLHIKLGEALAGLTMAIVRERTASISGTVSLSGQRGPLAMTMVVARRVDEEVFDSPGMSLAADGTFTIGGLLPGRYALETRSYSGNEGASTEVVVGGTDITGVVLKSGPGFSARGQIRFEGGTPRDLQPSDVFLFAEALDSGSRSFDMGRPPVSADWTFELTGLTGQRHITGGTVSRWTIKSVSLNGTDVTETPIDFTTGDVSGIEVLLTNRISEISGKVTDARGAIAADAAVVIFPADSAKWTARTRHVAAARPDQQGRFTIEGLPAGRYLAIAIDYLEEGQEHDPDLLKQWAPLATDFTLGDGEARAIDLKVTETN